MCVLWASCWAVTILSDGLNGTFASVGFIVAMILFASGETLLSPSLPALVNDLAPEDLRGRYNAAYTLSWSTGHIAGPALAGVFLSAGLAHPFFLALIAGCFVAAAYALRLERSIPPEANVISEPELELPPPPEPVPVFDQA
jgi:MFS family permease